MPDAGTGTAIHCSRGFSAETPEQIKAAKGALDRWLSRHPDDFVASNKRKDLTITEAWMRIKREWT
jgi:hypothetical protein